MYEIKARSPGPAQVSLLRTPGRVGRGDPVAPSLPDEWTEQPRTKPGKVIAWPGESCASTSKRNTPRDTQGNHSEKVSPAFVEFTTTVSSDLSTDVVKVAHSDDRTCNVDRRIVQCESCHRTGENRAFHPCCGCRGDGLLSIAALDRTDGTWAAFEAPVRGPRTA